MRIEARHVGGAWDISGTLIFRMTLRWVLHLKSDWPAAARNLIPLSRFPQGKAGAGRFPPRRGKARGSTRKRGFKALRCPPLRIPPMWHR